MANTNITVFSGRITAELEHKTTPSGISVCSFSLAVDDGYGEKKKTYFPKLIAWRSVADFLCKYGQKGAEVTATCRYTERDYTNKDGEKRRVYEFVVNDLHLHGKASTAPSTTAAGFSPADFEEIETNEDDLPF